MLKLLHKGNKLNIIQQDCVIRGEGEILAYNQSKPTTVHHTPCEPIWWSRRMRCLDPGQTHLYKVSQHSWNCDGGNELNAEGLVTLR